MKFDELVRIYNNKKGRYKSLLLELQELRDLGALPHTGENEGMPTSKSATSSVENYVIRVDSIERQIKSIDEQLLVIRDYIMQIIDNIVDIYTRRIVELCTFRNGRAPDWRQIASAVNYSERHTKRLYEIGLSQIQNIDVEVNCEYI